MSDYTTEILVEALKSIESLAGPELIEQARGIVDEQNLGPTHRLGATLWTINKLIKLPRARRLVATAVAEKANALIGHKPTASPLADELTTEGIVRLPPLLSSAEIRDILDHLGKHGQTYPENTLLHYKIDSIANAPHVLGALTSRSILDIVGAYLQAWPFLVEISAWESLPGDGASWGAQLFHRDKDDFRSCKLFVYLNDVGSNEGPHIMVRRSHVGDDRELFRGDGRQLNDYIGLMYGSLVTEITGPAGTTFLEDTYCFHRGKPPTGGRRIILQGLYGLLPYPQRAAKMSQAKATFTPDDPRARHAIGLIRG